MTNIPMTTLNAIAQAIYDKKGSNILALDVRGISSLTDYVIIAEGNVDRHLIAILYAIKEKLHKAGLSPMYVEGERSGDWIVADYGEIVIHLFQTEYREKYALENLWRKAGIIDLEIVTQPSLASRK
ncbi:MAG: ribosome silencing factor [Parachlamydiaceae bacterium]|nr:ribosome silencing factor [Parachlamydiaceae bacterium]